MVVVVVVAVAVVGVGVEVVVVVGVGVEVVLGVVLDMKTYAQQFASKGGAARATKLSKARKTAIAKKAARARWGRPKGKR